MAHPNEELMRKYTDASMQGDFAAATALYADDIVATIPGRSPLAGVYRGRKELEAYVGKVVELTGGTFENVALLDLYVSDQGAVTRVKERFARGGETMEVDRLFVYAIANGKIQSIQQFDEDQYAVDKFFS